MAAAAEDMEGRHMGMTSELKIDDSKNIIGRKLQAVAEENGDIFARSTVMQTEDYVEILATRFSGLPPPRLQYFHLEDLINRVLSTEGVECFAYMFFQTTGKLAHFKVKFTLDKESPLTKAFLIRFMSSQINFLRKEAKDVFILEADMPKGKPKIVCLKKDTEAFYPLHILTEAKEGFDIIGYIKGEILLLEFCINEYKYESQIYVLDGVGMILPNKGEAITLLESIKKAPLSEQKGA